MQHAGLEAFARRRENRSGIYSHEQAGEPELEPAEEERLRGRREAWDFFSAQAASYRKAALWWAASAKRADTGRGAWPRSSTTRPRGAACVTSSGQAAAHDREHEVFRS